MKASLLRGLMIRYRKIFFIFEIPDNHVFGYKRIQDGEKDKLRISFLKTGNITIFLKRCKRLYSFDCGFSGMV